MIAAAGFGGGLNPAARVQRSAPGSTSNLEPLLPGFLLRKPRDEAWSSKIQRLQGNELTVGITARAARARAGGAIHVDCRCGCFALHVIHHPRNLADSSCSATARQLHRRGERSDWPGAHGGGGTLFDEIGDALMRSPVAAVSSRARSCRLAKPTARGCPRHRRHYRGPEQRVAEGNSAKITTGHGDPHHGAAGCATGVRRYPHLTSCCARRPNAETGRLPDAGIAGVAGRILVAGQRAAAEERN